MVIRSESDDDDELVVVEVSVAMQQRGMNHVEIVCNHDVAVSQRQSESANSETISLAISHSAHASLK